MQNNNPAGEMKKITEGEIRSIIGEPKECEERESVRICIWKENDREIKVTFNLVRRNTISKWTSRGF
jgi:hypothetical protein